MLEQVTGLTFFTPDHFLSQVNICDDFSYNETEDRSAIFKERSIPLQRIVQDSTVNNYGYKLTEFCKNNDIYIVNSRVGNDKNVGAVTCRNCSTVDYVLASANVFEKLEDFDIHDFCNLFSDVHNPVSFFLSTCYLSRNISTGKNHSGIKLWCPDKADQFRSNIDVQAVKCIENYLNEISNSPGDLCSDNINKVVKDICTVFTEAARDTFGPSHFSPCIEKHNKPLFNSVNLLENNII